MFSLTAGSLGIAIVGALVIIFSRSVVGRWGGAPLAAAATRATAMAAVTRFLWLGIYLAQLAGPYPFAVFDDEQYHLLAMGMQALREPTSYSTFLSYVYLVFGASSLNGRLVNVILGVAAVYPLAYIERIVVGRDSRVATWLYAVVPFQIFWTAFEVKDVALVLVYLWAYAVLCRWSSAKASASSVACLAVLALLTEQLRTGMGVLILLVAALQYLDSSARRPRVLRIAVGAAVLGAVVLLASAEASVYFYATIDYLSDYQEWVPTQFSDSSIYSLLLIRDVGDLWKVPICMVVYALQPITGLAGSGRLFIDYGWVLRAFDVGVQIAGLVVAPVVLRRERARALLFLVPYMFVSCVNLTNARQGTFLLPMIYLFFAFLWDRVAVSPRRLGRGISSDAGALGPDPRGRHLARELLVIACGIASAAFLLVSQ